MADEAFKRTVREQLSTAWLRATNEITEVVGAHLARFKAVSSAGGAKVTTLESSALVGLAMREEANKRAEAITNTIVDRLLDKIESLEGRIEEMEVRIATLGASGPTSTPTEL